MNAEMEISKNQWRSTGGIFHREDGFFGLTGCFQHHNFLFLIENSILKIFGSVDVLFLKIK
jgi:hypothetical protein